MIDILIIGSGGAGLSAALNSKDKKNNVTVLSKTFPTHSQTCQAQGGINAAMKENDSVEIHMEDTYKSSQKLANKNNIELLCKNAKDSVIWLDNIGVSFSKDTDGSFMQRPFGGTKKERTCYSSDYTGLKILHTLYDQCIKEQINFLNEYLLLSLIKKNGKVIGVTALNIRTSKVKEYYAKVVILATGGYAGLYNNHTTNSYASTGDGVAVAFRAGCHLSNMEFVQFHPTALKYSNILISESARAEGGYLVTKDGVRFIDELSTRDEIARAIFKKIEKDEQVFIDVRHLGINKILETMPQEHRIVKEFMNLKMEEDLIPINPAAHYSMGGIKTNVSCETNLENLLACGECAQTNVHGANRLGGNSLLEIIVFGRIAGKNAYKKSLKIKQEELSSKQLHNDIELIKDIYGCKKVIDLYKTKEKLGKSMFDNLGLFKTKDNMEKTLNEVRKLKNDFSLIGLGDKSFSYNKNLIDLLELRNKIVLCQLVIISALNRCESRGAHYRNDFAKEEQEFEKSTLIYLNDNNIKIKLEDI